MYNFFVLGLVPGTDIQITFLMWCDVVGLLACVFMIVRVAHLHRQLNTLPPTIGSESPLEITLLARQVQLIHRIAATLLTRTSAHL